MRLLFLSEVVVAPGAGFIDLGNLGFHARLIAAFRCCNQLADFSLHLVGRILEFCGVLEHFHGDAAGTADHQRTERLIISHAEDKLDAVLDHFLHQDALYCRTRAVAPRIVEHAGMVGAEQRPEAGQRGGDVERERVSAYARLSEQVAAMVSGHATPIEALAALSSRPAREEWDVELLRGLVAGEPH